MNLLTDRFIRLSEVSEFTTPLVRDIAKKKVVVLTLGIFPHIELNLLTFPTKII
jgi:hypothetical protein